MSSNRMNELAELIEKLKNQKNEDGKFYQRSHFIKNIESLLNTIPNNNMWFVERKDDVLQHTIDMVNELLNPNQQKNPQDIMYQYGQKIICAEFKRSDLYLRSQALVFAGLGVNLHSLEIFLIDKEIERVRRLELPPSNEVSVNEQRKQHQAFIASLQTFREAVLEDLDGIKENEKCTITDIVNSESNQLVKNTAAMLSNLTYRKENKETDKEKLMDYARQLPQPDTKVEKFGKALKAVGIVCLAGLGFIVGAVAGLIAGTLAGAISFYGVGGLILGPVGLVAGGVSGAVLGLEKGKSLAGFKPDEGLSRYLFFKSNPQQAGKEISQKALELIDPNVKSKKNEKLENSSNGMNPEVLARYYACR